MKRIAQWLRMIADKLDKPVVIKNYLSSEDVLELMRYVDAHSQDDGLEADHVG